MKVRVGSVAQGEGASAAPAGPGLAAWPDTELVRAARLGDHEAFAQIVERYGPGMVKFAARMCADDALAGDIVQEAFVSAWKGLAGFEQRSSLRTWLYRLVHRRAADAMRRKRPVPIDDRLLLSIERVDAVDPVQHLLDRELVAALTQTLGELPWNQRAVWLLREVEAMSYDEIAAALTLSHGAVRGHLHRARRNVTERMARWR